MTDNDKQILYEDKSKTALILEEARMEEMRVVREEKKVKYKHKFKVKE